jgi:pimeloyl-ACP methyl ester carboxylesterase
MERPIAFANDAGQTLHGILHLPESRVHSPLGVVLLSPGQKCRLGPWRSYVRLARRLTGLGVPVLRFDFHGLGDSDGEHPHGQFLVDFNGFVQTGGLVRDVFAATAFFAREAGVTRFVFAGLCGGAATGLLAAPHIPGVYGHVMVDLPVTISSSARQRYLEQHAAELLRQRPEESRAVLRGYLARLSDPSAWRRLLSGASDYRLLAEAARRVALDALSSALAHLPGPLAARARAALEAPRLQPPASPPRGQCPHDGSQEEINEPTIRAFEAVRATGQKLFFLNSSAYQLLFHAFFGAHHLPADRGAWRGLGLLVVPETNHVLSPDHGQQVFFETVEEFVRNAMAELAERPSLPLSARRHDPQPVR